MADGGADPRDLSHHLAVAIGRVNRRMRSTDPGALGHGHLSVLGTLSLNSTLRLHELAAREVVSRPSMTRIVTELESRGYVRRVADPDDRRSVFVELTEKGEEMVFEARSERAELLATMMGDLTARQRRALASALPALERMALPVGGPA